MDLGIVVDDRGFRDGLLAGTIALGVLLALVVSARRHQDALADHVRDGRDTRTSRRAPRRRHARVVAPLLGPTTAVAAGAALAAGADDFVEGGLGVGLLLLVLGPYLAAIALEPRPVSGVVAAGAAVPGALVVADSLAGANSAGWVGVLVVLTIVGAGALVADFDAAHARAGLAPGLVAIAACGMYATLPDTEEILVVLGVVLPLLFAAWPVAWTRYGPGAYAVTGLLAWTAAVGGRGRDGAVVGALACLGVLLVEPVVRRALGSRVRLPETPISARSALVVGIQIVAVVLAARVAGLRDSAVAATVLAVGILVAVAATTAFVLGRPPRPRSASRRAGTDARREGPRPGNS